MRSLIIIVIAIVLFYSCSRKNKSFDSDSMNDNPSMADSSVVLHKDTLFTIYGNKEILNTPIRIFPAGDRMLNKSYGRNPHLTLRPFKSETYDKYQIDSVGNYNWLSKDSFGYFKINENVVVELVGFGWNDNGLQDDVKYHIYMFSHNRNGEYIDHLIVAEANNIEGISFKELNFISKDSIMVIDYQFKSNIAVDDVLLNFSKHLYQLNENGYFLKLSSCNTKNYTIRNFDNRFIGLSRKNPSLLSSEYWKPCN